MNRAFISLYLIVVLSIILLGLALNKFWEVIDPTSEKDAAIIDLIILIENSQKLNPNNNGGDKLFNEWLSLAVNNSITTMRLEDFSNTKILTKIKNGEIINASNDIYTVFYKRLNNSDNILVISSKNKSHQRSPLYIGSLILFYVAIAIIIFLWVWPVSRDLLKLTRHTHKLGKNGASQHIDISPRSVLFPFAKSFNTMALRLSEVIASQKEMTYAISHELRTPLARMKFALAMAEEQIVQPQLQKQFFSIRQDITDMESLINALLTYASFEQQAQPLNQRAGRIQDLLQEIISRMAIHKKPTLHIAVIDETEGELYLCEWALMQTAVQNILNNAIDFAQHKIIIRVKIASHNFQLHIEDDGQGVPEDQRERIFESFVRLYAEPKERSGFGLGLAIVRRIMQWHHGSIECTVSTLGGACFTLTWPSGS